MWFSEHYRLSYVGEALRRSVIEAHSQSTVSCEVRLRWPGLCLIRSWNIQEWRLQILSGQPAPITYFSHLKLFGSSNWIPLIPCLLIITRKLWEGLSGSTVTVCSVKSVLQPEACHFCVSPLWNTSEFHLFSVQCESGRCCSLQLVCDERCGIWKFSRKNIETLRRVCDCFHSCPWRPPSLLASLPSVFTFVLPWFRSWWISVEYLYVKLNCILSLSAITATSYGAVRNILVVL